MAASLYPGDSHYNQAMSELGAQGSPVHVLSPIINNYPLAALFVLFGYGLIKAFVHSKMVVLSGLLITLHGLASCVTGFFPCDIAGDLEFPSLIQNIHNMSDLLMFFSLLCSTLIWVFITKHLLGIKWFSWFSLACALAAIALLPLMGAAVESGVGFGLYQRLNYAAQVSWIMVLALILLRVPALPLPGIRPQFQKCYFGAKGAVSCCFTIV